MIEIDILEDNIDEYDEVCRYLRYEVKNILRNRFGGWCEATDEELERMDEYLIATTLEGEARGMGYYPVRIVFLDDEGIGSLMLKGKLDGKWTEPVPAPDGDELRMAACFLMEMLRLREGGKENGNDRD